MTVWVCLVRGCPFETTRINSIKRHLKYTHHWTDKAIEFEVENFVAAREEGIKVVCDKEPGDPAKRPSLIFQVD